MVFVLDAHHKPLMPCTEKRARLLLQRGRAVAHRPEPFTIRLKDRTREGSTLQPLRLKLDPGSKVTGVAVLRFVSRDHAAAVCLGEIAHRQGIKKRLDVRRGVRRNRRNRKTRHRPARFDCRARRNGRLPPSLAARVDQTLRVVGKLTKLLPLTEVSVENIRFDTQALQNPEISGVNYQRGTLAGYEVREYLLEKFRHECAYCGGASGDPVLKVDHVVPRSRGGTDQVSNLALVCRTCNEAKDDLLPVKWLEKLAASNDPLDRIRAERFPKTLEQLQRPLRDTAMMNATRWAVWHRLKGMGMPTEAGSGARTKYNRTRFGLPKDHCLDAACVGASTPERLTFANGKVVVFRALGRGHRRMANVDRYGFPKGHRPRSKSVHGFRTGDAAVVRVPSGKYAGTWRGTVAVRSSGSFDLKDAAGKRMIQGISWRHFRLLGHGDGWQIGRREAAIPPTPNGVGFLAAIL